MKYNTTEKALLDFIKSIFNPKHSPITFENKDWKDVYFLAKQHGIAALLWDKTSIVSKKDQMPKSIKLPWALSVEKQENRYAFYCKVIQELTEFYKGYGIGVIQIKGVGFSVNYPNPSHREGGDIDIFTYSLDKNKMSDTEANDLSNQLMIQQGIDVDLTHYKHSTFNYKGIPIENHRVFLNEKSYDFAIKMDRILFKILNDSREKNHGVMGEKTELLNGAYCIQTPPAEFNAIFLAYHSLQHLGSGLTLHHIVDWAILLQKFGWCMPKEVTDKKFLSYCHALNQLCKDWFGIDVGTPNEPEKANLIAQEIFHPKYTQSIPATSSIGVIIYKLKRMLHHHNLVKNFIPCSLSERIWNSIKDHFKNPATYLKK